VRQEALGKMEHEGECIRKGKRLGMNSELGLSIIMKTIKLEKRREGALYRGRRCTGCESF